MDLLRHRFSCNAYYKPANGPTRLDLFAAVLWAPNRRLLRYAASYLVVEGVNVERSHFFLTDGGFGLRVIQSL